MNKKITFKNMDHSAGLENHANEKLEKIVNFLEREGRTPITIELVFMPSKVNAHHKVELLVKTPDYDRVSSYEGTDFYDVLHRVIDTMYRELHEDKQRRIDDRKQQGRHDEFKKQR